MNNPYTVAVVPKVMCRRFSAGSLQYFKQNEEVQTGKKVWHKFAKGILLSMSVGGISFSAVHTRNLYDSKQKCKAYWNQQLK